MRILRGPNAAFYRDGGLYHLMNRSCRQQRLFHTTKEYETFKVLIAMLVRRYAIQLVSFIAMPTHFHIIIRYAEGSQIQKFIQQLCCKFSKYLNTIRKTMGTNFEGRYLAKRIHNLRYLATVLRYVHTNPVKDRLVRHPKDWMHSDFLAFMKNSVTTIQRQVIALVFGSVEEYLKFIDQTLDAALHISFEPKRSRPYCRTIDIVDDEVSTYIQTTGATSDLSHIIEAAEKKNSMEQLPPLVIP